MPKKKLDEIAAWIMQAHEAMASAPSTSRKPAASSSTAGSDAAALRPVIPAMPSSIQQPESCEHTESPGPDGALTPSQCRSRVRQGDPATGDPQDHAGQQTSEPQPPQESHKQHVQVSSSLDMHSKCMMQAELDRDNVIIAVSIHQGACSLYSCCS